MTKEQAIENCQELNKNTLCGIENDRCVVNVPAFHKIEEKFIVIQVKARIILSGLAITNNATLSDKPEKGCCFTHIKSGRRLPFGQFKSERSALIKANKIKELLKQVDWCQPLHKMNNNREFTAIVMYFNK